ncbi:MAG: helix-turn-helix domain-containing protein [Cyclobacteriaceae bacterium]
MKKTEILPNDLWNDKKLKNINKFIKDHSEKQSKERKIRNKLLSIEYRLEDYIERDDVEESEVLDILDFVKMYLKALQITKKELAEYFGMKDGNLHMYLTGKRKLNTDVVLKISSFSHTKPEYWYRVQVKNDLLKLKEEKTKEYEKYDYKKLIPL